MRNQGVEVPNHPGQLIVRIRRVCVFAFLVAIVPAAYACKCAQVSLEWRFHESNSIFTAEVIGTSPSTVTRYGFEGPGYRIYLRVLRSYDAFVAALDAAPKSRPRLERLFGEPGVME